MDDLERFFGLVEEHQDEADFVGPRAEGLVTAAERTLDLSFPPTYRRFVAELGAGDIAGQEFYGVITDEFVNSSVPNGVWLTLKARDEWGLPDPMVVVAFDGGVDYYVIDTAKAADGQEPPIEIWRPGMSAAGDQLEQVASDFGEFVLQLTAEGLGVS
jgi:hypothetical protein